MHVMITPDIHLHIEADEDFPDVVPVLGQRSTRQRKLIYDILRSSDEHLDVETLYRKARDIDSRVSLSTVYRTISLLKESDLVDELVFDDDRRCYEFKKSSSHHHIRCLSCGEIIEFDSSCVEKIKDKLEEVFGYQIESVRITVTGYCPNCKAR